ncbi:Myopalladin-like [Homarus americanus]|uniref:Myopalladin-like n=1 Tax=Homarus americanus TaxID=6706 RepID=A0A8J5N4Z6_HOMAM|nr:Myopalladin-like [Homarus americanus]
MSAVPASPRLDGTIPQGLEDPPLVAVYAVRGQTTRLPCNLTSAPEEPVILVLWYKNGTKTPVFSVDLRHQQKGSGSTRASDFFQGRGRIDQEQRWWSWALVVREEEEEEEEQEEEEEEEEEEQEEEEEEEEEQEEEEEEEQEEEERQVAQCNYISRITRSCPETWDTSPCPGELRLVTVYWCYKRHGVSLTDLPQQLRIYGPGGALVDDVAAVQEGQPLTLSCRATGGKPLPNVTWWSGSTMLDKEVEEHQEGVKSTATPTVTPTAAYATNTLRLASVSSAHLTQNLTCKAANTPALASLSASVMLRELDSELQVSLHAPKEKLSGGHPYNIKCEASGVRPPPVLTWWLRGQHLTHDIHVQSLGLDSTVSELSLLATAGDDGGLLECRAAAPTLPHLTATDSTRLTVHCEY